MPSGHGEANVDGGRRSLLGYAVILAGSALAGCPSPPPPKPAPLPRQPPPIQIRALTDLLPAAGLRWLVVAKVEKLVALPWLKTSLSRVLHDERLDLLAATTGLDLRQLPELALAAYGSDGVVLYLARHRRDPIAVERLFRERLTSRERRSVEDEQLVRVSGLVGREPRVFVALGPEVVGFQYGGNAERGPARIALLYAGGRLSKIPTVAADEALAPLWTELGATPVRALLPGPFDETLAGGARGLLAAATAVAVSATPTANEALAVAVLLGGDFTADEARARELLAAAWDDLAKSDLGSLLGLHQPRTAPRASSNPFRLRLDVEVDPAALFGGLAAATMDNIREIMR